MKKERLSVKLVGHDYVVAFPNDKKTKANEPDFVGDGIAIWKHEYEEKKESD